MMEMEKVSPETAYVKSIQLLNGGISNAKDSLKKIKSLQGACFVLSILSGILMGIRTVNPLGFFLPVAAINLYIFLRTRKVCKAFDNALKRWRSDKVKLEEGLVDPRDYYKARADYLINAGKAKLLDGISGDTSGLVKWEREMLSKFSDEEKQISKE